jgi:hypothetical protein
MLVEVGFPSEKEGDAGIGHSGGGRPDIDGFYRSWAVRRCGGGEVVQRPATVSALMYQLQEWRGDGRMGNRGAGCCQKGKRRKRAHLGGDAARGAVARVRPASGDSWSGCGRGKKLGRLCLLGLDCGDWVPMCWLVDDVSYLHVKKFPLVGYTNISIFRKRELVH